MSTTITAKDVIRVATRAYTNGSVKGVRTYLHVNCGCRIASSLMGTYSTMDDARRKAFELVKGTGDTYRMCSKSGLVKAQALGRDVRHFDDTMRAAASTFNGAGVRDGDVVVVTSEGVVGIVIRAAVIAITVKRGNLIGLDTSARTFRDGLYAEIVDRAEAEARKIRATVDPLHAAPAEEPATTAEEIEAAKLADIEARVSPLDADETRPRTMFDPELTYYADGTRVIMRAKGTERTGVTFGMASGAAAYAYQAVRWDDGGADLVAPHVLHRAEEVTPADVVRTDGVKVKADGRGKWIVVRGGDFLGTIFDEGPEMKRGRFAGWSPYAGTPGNTTAFTSDPAEVVESIVQAWPVTAAELVGETGRSLDDVLGAAYEVTEEWKADGRRAVLAIAAATGPATKMTREAAAEVRARLAAPVPPLVLDLAPGHCVHGEYAAGVEGDPAAVCARKGSGTRVGVFNYEGCVEAFDCAVQAASAAYVMNAEDEDARERSVDEGPLYTWAVLCEQHEEQRADGCEECAEGEAEEEAPAELPGPQWGTLKGFEAPFRLWGTEREDGWFRPAGDRTQVTGEPLVIAEVWTTQRGTARHGRDANGREISLGGAATRFWAAPGA